MKTGKRIIRFSISLILIFTVFAGISQDTLITKIKTIEKEFNEKDINYFGVTNTFGNIDISHWNENKVKVIIKITVIAWEEDDANRFIEKLIPEITLDQYQKGQHSVYLATNLSNIRNLCKCNDAGKKIYAPWFKKNAVVKQYRINYEVKIPMSVKTLSIFNGYGNISVPDFEGNISLQLTNGNLKAGNLIVRGSCPGITIRYGKAHIEGVENAHINLYSCKDTRLGNLDNAIVNSKFSAIHISSCSGLVLNSKNDDITIDNLESLNGAGSFTSLMIGHLGAYIDFYNKSGEIQIGETNPEFEYISLDGQYNDYLLNLQNLSYSLTADLEFTDLKSTDEIYPEQKRKQLISGKATFTRQIGNQAGNSKVTLKCSNCNVDLK